MGRAVDDVQSHGAVTVEITVVVILPPYPGGP